MKFHRSLTAIAIAGATALTLTACGGEDDKDAEEPTSTTATSTSEVAAFPTAMELNDVLARATDPALPIEEKAATVEKGEEAPELFDVMARAKEESGATLEVVEPVLPGYTPDSVLVGVNFILPEQEPQLIEGVEFRHIDGKWKLAQTWACTLVQNVAPDQVPPMCLPEGMQPPPPPEGDPAAPDAPPVEPAPDAPPAPEAPPAPPAPEAPPAPPAPEAPPAPPAPEAPPA